MRRWMGLALAVGMVVVGAACVPVGPGGSPQPTNCTQLALRPGRRARARARCRPSSTATPTRSRAGAIRGLRSFNSPHNQCGQKGPARRPRAGCHPGTRRRARSRCSTRASSGATPARWPTSPARRTSTSARRGRRAPRANGDCNGDGRFDIADFAGLPDRNGNGIADPEDLILDPAYNNGVDDDHNGYVDDISGWDFLYDDNDPLDTVNYGHGTGEAEDSTAAANGTGNVGTCPNCRFLPVRVGDSFVADGGRFAAGVLFALDSGADVIQEALGAISNPRAGAAGDRCGVPARRRRRRVDGRRGGQAPEPARLARAHDGRQLGHRRRSSSAPTTVNGYLALNGCTNFGGHTFVSIPSGIVLVGGDRASAPRAWSASSRVESRADTGQTSLGRTRSCRSCARPPTTSTSRRRTRSIPPTTSARPTGGLLDTVRYPTDAGLGRDVRLRAASTCTRR